ncbi:unnamed protein product [Symbiodinium sp. CCMP2592]|nr:unnamed protein product [Symbiodinium sp. CCMP2592]
MGAFAFPMRLLAALLGLGFRCAADSCGKADDSALLQVTRSFTQEDISLPNACNFTSETMWPNELQQPYVGVLKQSYRKVEQLLAETLSKAPAPCQDVVLKMNIYPKTSGKAIPKKGAAYAGQAGCGVYLVSDWAASTLASEGSTANGWVLMPFPTDAYLAEVPHERRSNEGQRMAKAIRVALPLLVPSYIKRVTYADTKCDSNKFLQDALPVAAGADLVLLKHPNRFGHHLEEEFEAVRVWMRMRHENHFVFDDVKKLEDFLGPDMINKNVTLSDNKCILWHQGSAIQAFSRTWSWYLAGFSMRTQLSFNAVLDACGQNMTVKFLPWMQNV